jgi:hypothetical protein
MRENLMSGSMWQGMETRAFSPQAPSLDPTTGRWGFCAIFKHFSGFEFSCFQALSTPAPYPLKTSFDRKRGRKDGKTTTLEPKNGFQKR